MVTTAGVLAGLGIAPVCIFFIVSTVSPNNPIAKLCVGARAGTSQSSAAVAPAEELKSSEVDELSALRKEFGAGSEEYLAAVKARETERNAAIDDADA